MCNAWWGWWPGCSLASARPPSDSSSDGREFNKAKSKLDAFQGKHMFLCQMMATKQNLCDSWQLIHPYFNTFEQITNDTGRQSVLDFLNWSKPSHSKIPLLNWKWLRVSANIGLERTDTSCIIYWLQKQFDADFIRCTIFYHLLSRWIWSREKSYVWHEASIRMNKPALKVRRKKRVNTFMQPPGVRDIQSSLIFLSLVLVNSQIDYEMKNYWAELLTLGLKRLDEGQPSSEIVNEKQSKTLKRFQTWRERSDGWNGATNRRIIIDCSDRINTDIECAQNVCCCSAVK